MKTIFLESHHIHNLHFGFGQFNYHLIKALQRLHPEDLRFVLHSRDPAKLKAEFGNDFQYKKYFSLRRYPIFRIRQKFDLWHSMNQNTKLEPYHDIPYVLTVHDHPNIKDVSSYKLQQNHRIFQEKLDRSDSIVYISDFARDSTKEFYDVPDVPQRVIHNGNPVSSDFCSGIRPDMPQRPFLFSIGVMDGRKNFDALVRMMSFLPDMELVISGKDCTAAAAKTKALIAQLHLSDRVTLTGKITDAQKCHYYKNCAAFVFPSTREGFGLPAIEAMQFGKPVFLSDMTSLPEIGGEVAIYWRNFEPGYMAGILREGLSEFSMNQPEFSKKLIARAQSFCWNKAAAAYCETYRELLY